MIEKIYEALINCPQVEAICLGGSRAGENCDEKSDYDVYVYITEMIPENIRKEFLSECCSRIEIGNHFWEYEDNCTMKDGIDIDILYRNLDEFCDGVANVVEKYNSYNGYTTCMWHNLLTCKVIYDKNGRIQKAKERFAVEYPEQLKRNIIDNNMKLLRTAMPAYELQIKKAAERNDLVSINHRTTEFFASYFDVIFALNKITHPGEKRLVSLCQKQCKILPANFKENIEAVFHCMFTDKEKLAENIDKVITELEKVLNI